MTPTPSRAAQAQYSPAASMAVPTPPIDMPHLCRDNLNMSRSNLKTELKNIADRLPESATYADAMYELYVRMKIAKGREAAADGRLVPQDDVKRKFAK